MTTPPDTTTIRKMFNGDATVESLLDKVERLERAVDRAMPKYPDEESGSEESTHAFWLGVEKTRDAIRAAAVTKRDGE